MTAPGESPAIVWFRRDLRLADNGAFVAACKHRVVIPVYIFAPEEEGTAAPGGASRWWLHHSLQVLEENLRSRGLRLIVRRGSSLSTLREIIQESGAKAVYWNRLYDPFATSRDTKIKDELRKDGVIAESSGGALLIEPWEIQNSGGKPFRVFTPFWERLFSRYEVVKPLAVPREDDSGKTKVSSEGIEGLQLLPKINWASEFGKRWTPGEEGGWSALKRFSKEALDDYPTGRDRPDLPGTSSLSPHLHFGELSPRQVWFEIAKRLESGRAPASREAVEVFLREIGWREFAHHLLFHFPHTVQEPLDQKFNGFRWRRDSKGLRAWQRGRTGFPIVDAGMRELWTTGWMHNRVRMIVGSFLVKDLLVSWRDGAEWFWDTLVDADLANNTLGWQWVAGCGADAAPFFRIFNPVKQGEKFDPDGAYVRRWIPELEKLPVRYIHKPWEAPENILQQANVVLGKTYPAPIVEHGIARERALEVFSNV